MAKTVLYYFSATGNSLAAAQELGSLLEDSVLIPIVSATGEECTDQTQRIGLVTPVYRLGLPRIVVDFCINTLACVGQAYYFFVLTYGCMTGAAGIQASRLLEEKGIALSLCASVKMVDNDIRRYRIPQEDKQQDILISADERLRGIAAQISEQDFSPAHGWMASSQLRLHDRSMQSYPSADRTFVVDSHCTRCGICEKICPVKNIRVDQKQGVQFLHHCEQCLACLHWCPPSAINVGAKTASKGRYHHPRIRLQDIAGQKSAAEC